jgi:uncharacterized membrane-anchored protein YitT (DUF2179 family)
MREGENQMGWARLSPEAKSAVAMLALILFMGPFVALLLFGKRSNVLAFYGLREPNADIAMASLAGVALALLYIAYCSRIPPVRAWLFRAHPLKLLALILAALAATLEELVFRKYVMDWLAGAGVGEILQVAASGVSFGAMHVVWGGLNRTWNTAIGSVVATTLLGLGLAVIYLLGGRSLAPCVLSHFLVTALIEPGLLIAAFGGGMRAQEQGAPEQSPNRLL